MKWANALAAAVVACAASLATACQSGGGVIAPSEQPGPETLTLGPGDVFEVHVYDEDDLSGKYRVDDDGEINFPLVGAIAVGGKTTAEIAKVVQAALHDKQILKNPHVSVYLVEQTSRQVTIMGAVKEPGSVPLSRGMTAVQALSLVGGLTPLANGDGTIVTRRVGGKLERFTLPIERITEGREPDFPLEPGDILFVPERLF